MKTRGTIKSTDAEIAEMKTAFELVEDKTNWKNPIDTTIALLSPSVQELLKDAIIFYTGSVPTFTAIGNGKVRVTAEGYYNACGA